MSKTTYIQIFSMTDHTQKFRDRYQGPYVGINSDLQTSEVREGRLKLSKQTKTTQGEVNPEQYEDSEVILAYRHSDTGELQGTSESLIPLKTLPWTDMPGVEILGQKDDHALQMKLWDMQELTLVPGQISRVHFGKTIVYLKNFGPVDSVEWTEENLSEGPSQLHAQDINHDVTIAPPTGSGFMVKQGQETEH